LIDFEIGPAEFLTHIMVFTHNYCSFTHIMVFSTSRSMSLHSIVVRNQKTAANGEARLLYEGKPTMSRITTVAFVKGYHAQKEPKKRIETPFNSVWPARMPIPDAQVIKLPQTRGGRAAPEQLGLASPSGFASMAIGVESCVPSLSAFSARSSKSAFSARAWLSSARSSATSESASRCNRATTL
jgi:hypothetical protein